MKIENNTKMNGIEVYFEKKPEQKIIDGLKKNGFRWHNIKKCWYAPKTQERALLVSLIAKNTEWTGCENISDMTQKEEKPKNKNLILEAGKIYGRGKEKDEKYFSDSIFDAFQLEDGRILTVDKESIKKDFCFGEHGYDYEEVLKKERDSRCFEYFRSENIEKLKNQIKEIEESLLKYEEEDSKPVLYFFKSFWCEGLEKLANWFVYNPSHWASRKPSDFDEARPASKEEIKTLLKIKKSQLEDMEKRLVIWWKKYGVEYLHTWTYWADA